jgi:large subunit ribosomal protein L4
VAAPKAPVVDATGKKAKDLTLEASIFGADVKPHLVHETVRAEMNGGRSKPWRQKGTGRARAGTTRAVQWTGGGVAFLPRTNFEVKVNKKERRAAFRSALSDLAAAGALSVLSGDGWDEPSTKSAAALLAERELPALVVATEQEEALIKSFRNLERVVVTVPSELLVGQLVWARTVLVSEAALPLVEGRASA